MTDESHPQSDDIFTRCEDVIGYRFRNREFLKRALTHASVSKTRLESNERLEFLGDSVLGFVVCELLYQEFPEYPEGELTRLKSMLVSGAICAEISLSLKFDRFLLLGKGLAIHDEVPQSIMAAAFESVIAAIYLDSGMDPAKKFILREVKPLLESAIDSGDSHNFKSLLQQHSQKRSGETPVYRLLDEKGPDHSKCFKVSAVIGTQIFAAAWGSNKKEAEQRAAENALCQIEGLDIPFSSDD